MNKKIAFLYLMSCLLFISVQVQSHADVYNAPGGIISSTGKYPAYVKYPSIQEAINNANEGDTVYVSSGIYHENIFVNKSVSLIGENRETTIIDGNGENVISLKVNNTRIEEFTLQNGNCGIEMSPWTHGHTINNNIMLNNNYGIAGHYDCTNISICNNIIDSNNIAGVEMLFSQSLVANNLISNNGKGVYKDYGSGIQIVIGVNNRTVYCINNSILGNTIKNHKFGVWDVHYSEGNFFSHNNFVNNTIQFSVSAFTWNNSLTENYWSDYDGTDANMDGVGDAFYEINEYVKDEHPLMGMFSRFMTSLGYAAEVVSNSTIEDFKYFPSNCTIKMCVSESTLDQMFGFCRICIPHELMKVTDIAVIIDDGNTAVLFPNYNVYDNSTHRWIYFAYPHSIHKIDIIAEFPSFFIQMLLMIAILLAVTTCKRRNSGQRKGAH